MLYITGDTHGDFEKILKWIDDVKPNKDKDFLFILGDFGYIWDNKRTSSEKDNLDFISCLPFTTLFIDGNHENHERLNSMRVVNFNGGKAHKVYDSIYHNEFDVLYRRYKISLAITLHRCSFFK